ncbi:hypothetical protein BJV82DRAFT_665968 [Fennellomyces sp. T-0311]|nr:hypothetical protein BJV82DRAFT_665968 [Fennellomyces sp. T-0311]
MTIRRTNHELKIERNSTKECYIVKLALLDGYQLNTFPLRDAYKETSQRVLDLAMEINGVQQGELIHYTISQDLVTAYTTVIGARHTAMHNNVSEFLETYLFFGFDLTINAVTILGNRNKEYYRELLEKQRFLRRGYGSNGQKFQSDALIDCIKKVMFCATSGRPRLPKAITRITHEIIVLVGLAMYYRVASGANDSGCPGYKQDFSCNSDRAVIYHGLTKNDGLSHQIDWEETESYVTDAVFTGTGGFRVDKEAIIDVFFDE